jgi:hypothetical protein
MLQGLGGSMLSPISLSIVRNTFHDPKERAQPWGSGRRSSAWPPRAGPSSAASWCRASGGGASSG